MATSNTVQHQTVQNYQGNNTYQCKDCSLLLNSPESLEVHVQYHKENLLNKWATQAGANHSEEANNNTTKTNIKREFVSNNTVSVADSSEPMHKKSPEYGNRTTPEANMFGHPPTPQSYHSSSSPYQNNDNTTFSPNFQTFHPIKAEPTSPVSHYQSYQNFPDTQFYSVEPNQQYCQEYSVHHKSYRYHPYQQNQLGPYERSQTQSQVSSSSPAYPPQPTPSPSPKQCDKCGLVCNTATQLTEHLNTSHPPNDASHLPGYPNFLFTDHQQQQIKTEEDAQSDILDLDSHKVHQVYTEEEKRQNGDAGGSNPHSVTAMLNSWPPNLQQHPQQQQNAQLQQSEHQKLFQPEHGKLFQADQKMFQSHPLHSQEYNLGNGVSTSSPESVGSGMNQMIQQPPPAYRPFEHLQPQPNPPVISSTQVPTNSVTVTGATSSTKSANWKSNEARRPKTYNCTACNKWFTSSGHLKRHYNTTLHKNAVKSSGQPDPATLPISAHHHPARDNNNRDESSGSPGEESRGEDTNSMQSHFGDRVMPGLLQQPPNGPYDRQPTQSIHHTPPLHSPMGHTPSPLGTPLVNSSNLSNVPNGSSPNGEAGPSPTNLDSRGLLLSTTPNTMGNIPVHGFNMGSPMMPMENSQFQMYPNEFAPHVIQADIISSINTTGEYQVIESSIQQPLPSFSQLQRKAVIVGHIIDVNVGGGGSVTAPFNPHYSDHYDLEVRNLVTQEEEEQLKYNSYHPTEQGSCQEELIVPLAPSPIRLSPNMNNNNNLEDTFMLSDCGENKISTVEDLKNEFENTDPLPLEPARFKREYEVSAPVVSSTVQFKPGTHRCIECDKIFNKACYLTQHNKTFHSGEKPFKCTRCGKRFSTEAVYKEHHSKHAGEKPHKCDLCPKQFNHKTDLRRHKCLHSGHRPYACETCGKGFIRKDHMVKHCESHLRKTMKSTNTNPS